MVDRDVNVLGIFAKYWEPGKVKTRLAGSIGAVEASEVYRAFVATLLRRFERLADERFLCGTPPTHLQALGQLAGSAWEVLPQSDGDLGQRMSAFFEEAFSRHGDRVVVIGSDSPNVPEDFLRQAFARLKSHHVVLGPTEDGGYYLIGMNRPALSIFEGVPWSTSSVLAHTVERIENANLTYSQLPRWYDVDEAADLERLHEELLADTQRGPLSNELLHVVTRFV